MGVIGAYFVGRILVSRAFPGNYALLFFLAFGFVVISWMGLALTREPVSEGDEEDRTPVPLPGTRVNGFES